MLWTALLSCADSRRNMRPANGPSDKHCRKALPWQRCLRCACTTWRHTSALTTRIEEVPAPSWRHSDGNSAPLTRGKCTPSFVHNWRTRKSGTWTGPIPLWEASSSVGFCRTILTGWSRQAPQTGLLGMYASNTWDALPADTSGSTWSLAWQTTWSCIWWDKRMASYTLPPSMHCSRFWTTRVSSGSSNGTKASWTRRTCPNRLLDRARGTRAENVPHARDLGRSLRPLRWRRGRRRRCRYRFRRQRLRRGLCLCLHRLLRPLQLYSLFVGRVPGREAAPSSTPVLAEHNPRTTINALTRSGRPGPKSRGKGVIHGIRNSRTMLSLLLYLHLISSTAAIPPLADTRVEGNPHLEPSGVGRSSNNHSTLRTNPTGVSPVTITNPVRKRAFARAQQRARIHGATRYKGRWMSAAELGVEPTPTPAKPQASPRKPAARFQYLSWNAGGLHVSRYQELKHWLLQPAASQLDLIAIQETHWQGAQEYATARHYAIHSGGSKSEAGLLVLINKHTFPESKIQHRDLIPGRLLHLRLESDPCIEVFIGYQHAWSLGARTNQPKHKETLLEKRSEFWTQLAKALHAVPKRNQVLVLADMNTDLHTDSIHVGKGVYVRQAQHASDANFLQELLRQQQLVALNTWRKAGPTSCTFLSASTGTQGSSQIDFALARHAHSDSLARQAKPMDLPFVPTQGLRHRPILGTIPYPRPPHGKPQKPVLTMKRVRNACLRLPALLPTFSMQVSHVHADHPHLDTATLLTTAWHRALAHQPQQETTPTCPDPQPLAIPLESLWALRKKVRGVTLRSLTTALGVCGDTGAT